MRERLAGITVRLDGIPTPGSTTLGAVGGNVLVCASALPDQVLALTSSYLIASDGAIAVTHLEATAAEEAFVRAELGPGQLHATVAGACLLDHVATLRELLARSVSATVSVDVDVDVDVDALERAAEAWGPAPPPG